MALNAPKINRPVTWLALWSPAAVFVLYIGGAVAAALAGVFGQGEVARAIGAAYAALCHQIPERSFGCAGEPMIICARCTGFFGGLALASLVIILRRIDRGWRWWVAGLACLPMLLDAGLDLAAMTTYANLVRALTGLMAGIALAGWFYPKFVAAVRDQLALRAVEA